jgi:hypothetical protein
MSYRYLKLLVKTDHSVRLLESISYSQIPELPTLIIHDQSLNASIQ